MAPKREVQCKIDKNLFCYLCGEYWSTKKALRPITETASSQYSSYFGIAVKCRPWTPERFCCTCVLALKNWSEGQQKTLAFSRPMLWTEPTNHEEDCYFCLCPIKGLNKNNRKTWPYPNVRSACRTRVNKKASRVFRRNGPFGCLQFFSNISIPGAKMFPRKFSIEMSSRNRSAGPKF